MKIVTVKPDRSDVIRDWGIGAVMIPAFSLAKKGGGRGQVRRQCTDRWKIRPIRKALRSMMPPGTPAPGSVVSIQGISLDEWSRMRTSDVGYIIHEYPLVDMRMTRADCASYLERHGLDIPGKSGCTFCPYHSRAAWKDLKARKGPDWEEAVKVDASIRNMRDLHVLYVHPARKPLQEAVRIPQDEGAEQLELCDGGVCMT